MAFGDRICDVSDPPAGFTALVPGNSGQATNNTTRLQQMVSSFVSNNPATARSIYFPPGIWEINGKITFPGNNSWHMFGGGGMPKGMGNLQSGLGSFSVIRWRGGTVGPMFHITDSDGIVWERLAFDGFWGCNKASGSSLDNLISFNAQTGGFFHEFKNCGFFNAQRLWHLQESSKSGPADILFHKCIFNCHEGQTSDTQWSSQAFYADENQTVNIVMQSCEFNNVGVCMTATSAGSHPAGRYIIRDATVSLTGLLMEIHGGSPNINGHLIDNVHLDIQGLGGAGVNSGAGHRTRFYKGVAAGFATAGNVVLRQMKQGSLGNFHQEFARISSYDGTNLLLQDPHMFRPGDKVAFVRIDNLDSQTAKIETTIKTKSSNHQYTTDPIGALSASQYYAADGEALIECGSSEFVSLQDSYLEINSMRNGRLARLPKTSNRTPKFVSTRCMGFWGDSRHGEASVKNMLTLTGSPEPYWRFEDADGVSDAAGVPITAGNFGVTSGGGGGGGGGTTTTVEIKIVNDIRVQRKYGVTGVEYFMLYDPTTGLPKPGLTFVTGDVQISQNAGGLFNAANLPLHLGNGLYVLFLSSSERTAAQTFVKIVDQTSPAQFMPVTIQIDSYGHVDAQHEFDLDNAKVAITTDGLDAAALKADAIDEILNHQFATEDYAPDGVRPNTRQALLMLLSNFQAVVTGTTFDAKRLDGVTTAMTYTTNDATNPTQKIRTG